MRDYFLSIADYLDSLLRGPEEYTCVFAGEDSDFARFNRARVRQAGRVTQRKLSLDLIEGRRHASAEVTLSGDTVPDRSRLATTVETLRDIRARLPEDPYLCYATEVCSSDRSHPNQLPDGAAMVEEILTAAAGQDLVGIHASGAIHAGFANSLGQRNWFTRHSFNLDWSLHLHTDKAVKARYAGFTWEREQLHARMSAAVHQLEMLARPARTLSPGRYRIYLPPMALEEIISLLGWGGFGMRAHRTGTSPLRRMVEEGASLSPSVTLSENTAAGVAPDFQAAGFVRPDRVILIEDGRYRDCLISPRSAAEYGVPGNGAGEHEAPLSMDMAPGDLPTGEILQALGTGVCVGNLWYLNYSDRNAGRLTGMTRFATFWVENGRIQGPVNPMRFDETVYHLLGNGLMGLTAEREMLLDPSSYGARSNSSARLPGALVDGVSFTL
jgi:predicted Zn-dependent protease